ncbi:hypothetical protein ZWY2020_039603 [Hordeum vulgare]|nr:hypothetical protein ZWY2020_039603 [Hordeum vulgare]
MSPPFLLSQPACHELEQNSNPNPFPWGTSSRAFFLGCSLGDHTKFENTMEVCLNFSNMEELHKESNDVVKKATSEELKTLIPGLVKGAMLVDILRWAMNEAGSSDAEQRAKWAKYGQYMHPHDHRAGVYFTTKTVMMPLEEDQRADTMEVEEEDAMAIIVRAPEPGERSMPIKLDTGEEEETVVHFEEKTKTNAKATRRSNRLQGLRDKDPCVLCKMNPNLEPHCTQPVSGTSYLSVVMMML